MKTALLFVLLSLSTLNTQAQIRRHIRTGISPHSPTGQTTLVGVNNGIKSAFGNQKNETLNSLPIRRVILYSNGIAYIERRGIVSNHAEVSLSFKQSQV